MKIKFPGQILILGCGAVSQCLQPLILENFDMDFSKLKILDMEDLRSRIPETIKAGAKSKESIRAYVAETLYDSSRHWDNALAQAKKEYYFAKDRNITYQEQTV